MVLVPGCKHDVFVSYAHVDDEPVPGQAEGWVSSLIKNLEWRLRQLSGRPDDFSLWMDHDLARTVDFSDQIIQSLHDTAILLIVLSPAYVSSDWCKTERDTFLALVKERLDRGSKVFVVERDKVDIDDRPHAISRLLGYKFWKESEGRGPQIFGHPHPVPDRDREYYDQLEHVARELHATLKQLAHGTSTSVPAEPQAADTPTVYLAEATDDLDTLRDQVARYLCQSNLRVVPGNRYPPEISAFRAAAAKDLEESVLFVQLLSGVPGKKLTGADQSFVDCQYQLALQLNKPILQWRSRDIQVSEVVDTSHCELLDSATVQVVDIEDFKREVVVRATAISAKASDGDSEEKSSPYQPFVFVNVEPDDMPLAEDLGDYLGRHGVVHALRMTEGTAEEIRKDLEANLLDCDGVIIVYGTITAHWIRAQLRQYCKALYRRERPLRALAVYEGPPDEKKTIGMSVPKMYVIDCRQGLNEEKLTGFIESLQAS